MSWPPSRPGSSHRRPRTSSRRRKRLKQQLEAPSKPNGTLPAVLPDMSQWFEQFIGDLAKLGPHQIDKVRGIIKDLVGGTITLKPTKTSQGKKLAALITPDYLGL